MSGAVRGSGVGVVWSNNSLGPSPIIRSARSSVVSLDGDRSAAAVNRAGGGVTIDSDAQGARATLARIRDLVNRSLDTYGDDDDSNSADLSSSLLDTSSVSATQRRDNGGAVTILQPPPPPPLARSERLALAPRAASIFNTTTQLLSQSNSSDPAQSLFALRQGINRALSLLPSVGDFARMGDTRLSSSSLFQNGSPTTNHQTFSSSLGGGQTQHQQTLQPTDMMMLTTNFSRGGEGGDQQQQQQQQHNANDTVTSNNNFTNTLEDRQGLSRDADISRLEDRVELLFVQVRDAARRAQEAAADATEALRKTADIDMSISSSSSLPPKNPNRRRLKTDLLRARREGGGGSTTFDNATVALDASDAAIKWLAGGGEGGEKEEVTAVPDEAFKMFSSSSHLHSPQRPSVVKTDINTTTATSLWLAGGQSPKALRLAAQRTGDARRAMAPPPLPPPPPHMTSTTRSLTTTTTQEQLGLKVIRRGERPWHGVRHGAWDPSRWARDVGVSTSTACHTSHGLFTATSSSTSKKTSNNKIR